MKKLEVSSIIPKIEQMCIEANYYASHSLFNTLRMAKDVETSTLGKTILSQIIENDEIASKDHVPMCQDTGIVVVFVEIGHELQLIGNLEAAIHEGIRRGYEKGYLRKSVVAHPLHRINTKDNTPAIIHYNFTEGDQLKITIAPKGAGSENVSAISMLKPSDGYEGVKRFVIDTVLKAGGNPCPPIIVGIGIGGNFEKCALLSKQALMREIKDQSQDEIAAKLETELLKEINELNIGPMGFGGVTTALAVKVNTYPCHIASLPVAVNIQCHASRHLTEIF
ncbi:MULTISPECIES: fumarate hydratase [Turicibacter]|jgi:hydrolyase, tartrate alpha subunit/fumarate domain protein, Fe-S type|uniref:Fumarate hydratase n=2 Tax=Turicibacter sanguinis TaxID=154288 RepID=A0A173THN8_9FIRM|nr:MULTISPECIES: fumarate hydratase [Turicibacter]KAB6704389.1 fumarate hydratase [Phocaeicola vulgatus]EFF63126.1 hydrolyase, tartrate alpha subunit/fumarate domain protein, Fe-S type [Turicibacter sanguinis PC909]EGC91109.1 hydrolyase, tartrate alpha subunit/fumarate domain protein, Fe-S type [Turicibacter sp. HGF1]MBP3905102.1 fumarate hydratase [Turicibacter sp.]MCU7190215.1 fumarate hydratase [Turicibacter sanguinis]